MYSMFYRSMYFVKIKYVMFQCKIKSVIRDWIINYFFLSRIKMICGSTIYFDEVSKEVRAADSDLLTFPSATSVGNHYSTRCIICKIFEKDSVFHHFYEWIDEYFRLTILSCRESRAIHKLIKTGAVCSTIRSYPNTFSRSKC